MFLVLFAGFYKAFDGCYKHVQRNHYHYQYNKVIPVAIGTCPMGYAAETGGLLLFTGLASHDIQLKDEHEQQYDIFFHFVRSLILLFSNCGFGFIK